METEGLILSSQESGVHVNMFPCEIAAEEETSSGSMSLET